MALIVADRSVMQWDKENIPDEDSLYRWVHREKLTANGGIRAGAFSDNRGAMSTDWSKYSTPNETRQRAAIGTPEECAVIALPVGAVRVLDQTVEHDPLSENRAHTNVIGDKTDIEIRYKLQQISQIVIAINSQ